MVDWLWRLRSFTGLSRLGLGSCPIRRSITVPITPQTISSHINAPQTIKSLHIKSLTIKSQRIISHNILPLTIKSLIAKSQNIKAPTKNHYHIIVMSVAVSAPALAASDAPHCVITRGMGIAVSGAAPAPQLSWSRWLKQLWRPCTCDMCVAVLAAALAPGVGPQQTPQNGSRDRQV